MIITLLKQEGKNQRFCDIMAIEEGDDAASSFIQFIDKSIWRMNGPVECLNKAISEISLINTKLEALTVQEIFTNKSCALENVYQWIKPLVFDIDYMVKCYAAEVN